MIRFIKWFIIFGMAYVATSGMIIQSAEARYWQQSQLMVHVKWNFHPRTYISLRPLQRRQLLFQNQRWRRFRGYRAGARVLNRSRTVTMLGYSLKSRPSSVQLAVKDQETPSDPYQQQIQRTRRYLGYAVKRHLKKEGGGPDSTEEALNEILEEHTKQKKKGTN